MGTRRTFSLSLHDGSSDLIGRAVQQECRDLAHNLGNLLLLGKIGVFRSEERFSRNAETDLVCRLLLEKKNVEEFLPAAIVADHVEDFLSLLMSYPRDVAVA